MRCTTPNRATRLTGARGRGVARRLIVLATLLGLAVAPSSAQVAARVEAAEPIPGLDAYVERAMVSWDVPGLALVLVRGDSIYARGYGVTEVAGNEPIDAHTLFGIGSLTKAFTATVLAMLVDEGKLAWDHPVIRHLPDFATGDAYVTEHVTIRDILSHRTGLVGDDLMWVAGGTSPGELIRRIRFQEPALGFRARYGYNNMMYLVAGELAARVAGKPWSALVHERIFEPLGMERSTAGPDELRRRPNVALPHDEIGPGQVLGNAPSPRVALNASNAIERVPWFDVDTPPAGAIGSSATEFGQWLRFQLDAGEVDGRRLLGEDALLATRTPQIPTPGPATSQSERSETNLTAYGMGWGVRDYRGTLMLSHLGSAPGWSSAAALLPAEDAAVAVFTNMSQGLWLADAIARWMLDRLLAADVKDWNVPALEWARERREAGAVALAKAGADRVTGTRPSLPLPAYAGTYVDSLYPAAHLALWNGRLRLVLGPNLTGDLDHWQDDTFRVTWDRADFGANFVDFVVDDADHPHAMRARLLGRQGVWRRTGEPAGEARERELDRGDPGSWDAHYTFGPYLLRHDGVRYMFHTGGGPDGVAIGYATSPERCTL
jgi:CubicO group peptidase (beta-lactamase class C family)